MNSRSFITLVLLLLATEATADVCQEVEEHSYGHITCTKDDFGYTLKYDSWLSRSITLTSDRYEDMLTKLCVGGGVIRETWHKPFKGTRLNIIRCEAER